MSFTRYTTKTLAALTLWAGFGLNAYAQLPTLTVDKAFEVKPRQPGVAINTPAADQLAGYHIDPIANPKTPGSNMGYVVRDAQNRPVRQFVSYDNKSFNIVAFYIDGVESYREVFPPAATEPFQFRWLGTAGGKWGLDRDRDGKVDEWVVMSPEEASQELFQAVLAKDAKRLEALLATKENLDALGVPAAEAAKIKDRTAKASQRLIAAGEALKLSPEARWVHLETNAPHTTPADAFGGKDDLVVHKNATILIQDGKEMKFLQTGELVMIGRAWKAIDGPSAGSEAVAGGSATGNANDPVITEAIKADVAELDKLDRSAVNIAPGELTGYYLKRAGILEGIVKKLEPKDQAAWLKLLIDSLASAGDSGPSGNPAHGRLKQIAEELKATPQNPLAAYAAFRVLTTENGIALREAGGDEKKLQALQEKWRTSLEEFVKTYPNSNDAPEAALRLAIAYEYAGREGEAKAKEWYDTITKDYAQHAHAARANGSKKRLESEGKPIDLVGPEIGTNQAFAVNSLNGKVVVVYYWASWISTLDSDARKLKELATTFGPKGLEIVTVCLDDDPQAGIAAIKRAELPGKHLHMRGGVEGSPLAAAYGVHLPPHVFLVGKDTKIVNRNGQVLTLEGELKILLPQ